MKKILSLLTITLVISAVMAKPVAVDDVLRAASNFYQANNNKPVPQLSVLQNTGFNQMYIIQIAGGEEGFMIFSADDQAYPVLAYGFTDAARDLGPETRFWLRQYEAEISAVANGQVTVAEDDAELIHDMWKQLLEGTYSTPKSVTTVSQLMTTTWNQEPYYNDYCPSGTPVGCVATAVAQVMKYWNHPAQGEGSNSYYLNGYGTQSANFGNTTYQWDLMPNAVTSSTPSNQRAAVALLCYHVGVGCGMSYAPEGSGAQVVGSGSAETELVDYFRYKSTLHGEYRSSYTDAVWIRMLKEELDASRPIVYAGYDNSAGHCFVFDGYNSSSQFHVNWGWGGYYNGYYSMGALNPTGGGTGTNTSNTFNNWNQALFGVEPIASLAANPSNFNMASNAESVTFNVISNGSTTSSWHATSSASWLTVTPTTGAGGGATTTVTATATANTTGATRSATITVTHGTYTLQIPVTQLTCERNNMCHLTVHMSGYSDYGWAGASVSLTSTDGVDYGTATLNNGAYGSQSFDVCSDTVLLTWSAGTSDANNMFSVENANGAVLATKVRNSEVSNGQVWTIVNPCASENVVDPITFAIDGYALDTLKGTVTGGDTAFRLGEECVLTAIPQPGYRFVRWNDGSNNNPRSITVTTSRNISATFNTIGTDTLQFDNGDMQSTYDVTDSTAWAIRLSPEELVRHRQLGGVGFYPTATGTYKIYVYEGGDDAPDSLVYQGSKAITSANIDKWYYFTFRTKVQINHRKNMWIAVKAARTGIAYANWCGSHESSWVSTDNGGTWSQMSAQDSPVYLSWLLRAAVDYNDSLYTLTASYNRPWGTITGGGQYHLGEVATLTATPKENYHFERWTNGVTDNPCQVVVLSDTTVRAIFAEGAAGIDDVVADQVKLLVQGRTLTVQSEGDKTFDVFDVMGRVLYHGQQARTVTLPAAGVYMVRVAGLPARRIVVY